MRLLALLPALLLVACADTDAPPAQATPDRAMPAVADSAEAVLGTALGVGQRAPDFELPSASGGTVRLSDHLARGPVVLVFYHGAWCPYCDTQLRDYQIALSDVQSAGASLIAISPQTPDSSLTMQERQSLTFPVLSDAGTSGGDGEANRVSRAYGLVFRVDEATRDRYRAVGIDLPASNGGDAGELPVPAVYVISRDGVIHNAFVEADYTQRASTLEILQALHAL